MLSKWTEEQLEAINKVGSNIIVSAGAGSGKTAVLTERTIRKLINGTNINRLLILTFTNAAASEMKNRIRSSIKKENLKEQLDYIDSAYITTFDSFALSIVKKYHYLLGVSPTLKIMDSSIEIFKTNEIIDEIFEDQYGDLNFDKLIGDFCLKDDNNIKEVIKDMSKKLDLLPNKRSYLKDYISRFYNQDNLDKYVKEYVNQVLKTKDSINEYYLNLKSLVDQKYLTDFNIEPLLNSKSYKDVKINLELIGSPRKNSNCQEEFKLYKDKITVIIKKLKDLVRFKDEDEMIISLQKTIPYVSAINNLILKFDEKFLKYKQDNNLYTFSDIALLSLKILEDNPDVKEEIKGSFDEIMIDEYQDTSDIQERFISLISNNNVYMVGDIKQSIYRFRHANPYIFRDKYDNYAQEKGGIKIDLLKNFRSRPEVLEDINLIFNLIMDNAVGDADYKKSHQMNFGNTSYIEELKTSQNNHMDILTYDPKATSKFSNDEVEAFTVAYDIKNKIINKYQIVDKETFKLRNCNYNDFAIIMDRGSSFDLYKKIFEYVGVPIIQIQNEKLTSGDDLVVFKNLMNLIVKINLKEYDDKFKYYYTSVCRSYLFRLDDEQIFDIIKSNNYYQTDLFKICQSINIFDISSLEFLNEIIDKFNFYDKILTLNNIEERIIKIDYLKDLSINLSNVDYNPIMFTKYLDEMIAKESIEYSKNTANGNSVKILNIHKSKGLEYSICYYTGLGKKANEEDKKARFLIDSDYNIITPYLDSDIKQTILKDILVNKENRDNVSERIRLFYVALTRAKEKMIILLPLENDEEGCFDLVPVSERLEYKRISDMLLSILPVLKPYLKEINFDTVILTREYEKIKSYNYQKEIKPSFEIIDKLNNNIKYEMINESRFSKHTNVLITDKEYQNIEQGLKLHKLFETEDFNTTNNPYILNFLKQIDKNYLNLYKEYEFIYEEGNELKHGFIDLMIEYENYINIFDYKLKNISDQDYLKQLKGYQKYIGLLTSKEVYIYLYSILDNKIEKIKV